MIVCSQAKNFTYCHTITSLHNAIKGQIAGIVIRNKGTAQFEAYVADSAGEIMYLWINLELMMGKETEDWRYLWKKIVK